MTVLKVNISSGITGTHPKSHTAKIQVYVVASILCNFPELVNSINNNLSVPPHRDVAGIINYL